MAKPSARPMTIQLVMIRPTNTDSCLLSALAKALSTWSTTITSEAMMTTCTIIRMALGIWLRISEMNMLEKPADRKSTRLNSSHVKISYAVFCLKKKKKNTNSSCQTWESYHTYY